MAVNQPYRISVSGSPRNTTSTTAPSLTDPSANTALLNQVVTVGTDTYYVDPTGKAVKLGSGGGAPVKAQLEPVLNILTAAQLAALTTQEVGDAYIVSDGANKGQIAKWDGSAWLYFVPTDDDVTTVTTGANAGTWQYDAASQTWVQTQTGITLPDPIERPVAGNVAFTMNSEFTFSRLNTVGPLFVVNDQIASFGPGAIVNGGDNGGADGVARKLAWNWSNLVPNTYTKSATYAPVFVDATMNSTIILALDSVGKVWAMGSTTTGTGLTTTPLGTTAITQVPSYGLMPVGFFHAQSILVSRVYTACRHFETNNQFSAALTTTGDVYVTGNNAWGQLGQNNTTNYPNWVKYPITNVVEVKLTQTNMFVRTKTGEVYMSGQDNYGALGAVGNKVVPTLVANNVKQFDIGGIQVQNIHVVKNDGTYWNAGFNTSGQLGRGTLTNVLGMSQVPGITNVKAVFPDGHSGTGTCLLFNNGTIQFAGANTTGRFGYAPNTSAVNNPTFVTPTGAYQGTVIDVQMGNMVTTVLTALGGLWNAGQMQWRGLGHTYNNWADNNKWQQVPLPEAVIGFRCCSESATTYEGCQVLMANHKVFGWGAIANQRYNNNISYSYSPMSAPLFSIDNGIAIENPLSQTI